jgi:hypothetical protein
VLTNTGNVSGAIIWAGWIAGQDGLPIVDLEHQGFTQSDGASHVNTGADAVFLER